MLKLGVLLLLLACASQLAALGPEELVVVVLSQADVYHSALARDLRTSLIQQSSASGQKGPKVYLTHEDFPHPGAWTVAPVIPWLFKNYENNTSWIIFCEERTRFNLERLISFLSQYDPSQEMWLGHGLQDAEPTIVHHFQFSPKPMQYPLLAAGFAMSAALLKKLYYTPRHAKTGFSIDAMYELAQMVNSTAMLSWPSEFCLENNHTRCASYPLPFLSCGEPVPNEDIFFAVKTCLKFHKERVPVIQNTWGKDASNIEFFSDVQDGSIPTTSVGIANTGRGHCAKTKAILELVLKRFHKLPNLQWLVLTDDDTLLSVPRLRQLLSCWSDQAVVVGERYGFEVRLSSGYNFPTGGAGTAINMAVLSSLVREFRCFADNAPDDMIMGSILKQLGIPIIHSPLFHQARPMDYPAEYLATQQPISFHKYWETDPFSVYEQWFSTTQPQSSPDLHSEL
ncbi:beta-1,3-glucosyltransferase isoform X2 [Macrosteles quadrilineatus]|uniref:beta-1,3-glucosyltransferase isoform X2 n=1 Tax=Macrosteles quadrilineatus TaxID=74068 RepID=UPI0023E2310B|nr:beta-1,3-glucosyltransferase isoform X2 [Macrosteles quadrilineatus]